MYSRGDASGSQNNVNDGPESWSDLTLDGLSIDDELEWSSFDVK